MPKDGQRLDKTVPFHPISLGERVCLGVVIHLHTKAQRHGFYKLKYYARMAFSNGKVIWMPQPAPGEVCISTMPLYRSALLMML